VNREQCKRVERGGGWEWLNLHSRLQQLIAYLAQKSVLTMVSRGRRVVPPAPALYAHNADPTSFGETAYGIPCSGTRSSGGFAATADSDFQTLEMFRGLGARLNVLQ